MVSHREKIQGRRDLCGSRRFAGCVEWGQANCFPSGKAIRIAGMQHVPIGPRIEGERGVNMKVTEQGEAQSRTVGTRAAFFLIFQLDVGQRGRTWSLRGATKRQEQADKVQLLSHGRSRDSEQASIIDGGLTGLQWSGGSSARTIDWVLLSC